MFNFFDDKSDYMIIILQLVLFMDSYITWDRIFWIVFNIYLFIYLFKISLF